MAHKTLKIILIDGNSLAYRAFYALPQTMTTSNGQITNAIYGFTMMLLKILEENPDFIAIAFDKAAPTFRHKEYKEYKATREKAPPTLYQQMPIVRKIADAFDIPFYELEGFEADDIIGTLAKKAESEGMETVIVSGDLDALQLVSDKISLLTTQKGITDTILYDEKAVERRFGGLKPEQLIDFKSLKGDTSDNIPGVPGIGEKGAIELLTKFGSLQNILKNPDKIESEKLRAKITQNTEIALLSKRLATIVTEVPIDIDFKKLAGRKTNWEKVLPLFEKLEFKTLIKKYGGKTEEYDAKAVLTKKREKIKELNYKAITSEKELDELISLLKNSNAFAIDLETTSENPFLAELVGLSFCVEKDTAFYIPIGHINGKQLSKNTVLSKLKPVIESDIPKYGQNIKYDMEVLENNGVKIANIGSDTMVAAYLLDPTIGGYGLKKLSLTFLNRSMIELDELIGKNAQYKNFSEVPVDIATDYAASDADVTFALAEMFNKKLKEADLLKLFNDVEVPLVEVLEKIEMNGVAIDTEKLHKMSKELEKDIKALEKEIFCITGEEFNINSPKQLAVILYDKLKLPITKRTKTGASTDFSVLEELAPKFEIARKLIDYRTLTKIKSTYVDVLPELVDKRTGRIHTSFNQTITATGRLSSSNPNLQNIPIKGELGQKLREAFVPDKKDWLILAADYSQIELRILAHLSGDEHLTKAFLEDKDVHKATAAEVFGVPLEKVTKEMRETAKIVNFGIIYGMGEYGLAKSLKIKKTEAAEYIKKYFEKHYGVKKFIDDLIVQAKKDGYVCTLLGRKRPLPDINSPNHTFRSFAERTAINTPVQGTAADIIKVAMVNIYNVMKKQNLKAKMILQVHDELVFEVPKSELPEVEKLVKQEMEHAIKLDIPVKVHIGSGANWAEAK